MQPEPLKPKPGQDKVLNGLARLLRVARYDRLIIAGGPGVGKTTLTDSLVAGRPDITVHRSSEIEKHPTILRLPKDERWSAGSLLASHWFDEPGPWICEGVAMPRAIRKWLKRRKDDVPADAFLWLAHPAEERSVGQHVMALGCATVWNEIKPELQRRGALLLEADET
jgi:Fe-S cluster assembly ATPase SufC